MHLQGRGWGERDKQGPVNVGLCQSLKELRSHSKCDGTTLEDFRWGVMFV